MGQTLSVLLTVYIGIGLFAGMVISGLTMFAPHLHNKKTETVDQIPWYDWLAVWLMLLFLWPVMVASAIIISKMKKEGNEDDA